MEVLKLKLFAKSACFRVKTTTKHHQTHPLPPYSTIIGMLHRVLRATSYIPMNISIQGLSHADSYEITSVHLQEAQKAGNHYKTSIIPIHEIHDLHLIIHVSAEPEVLQEIADRIYLTDICLGKREHTVRIDSVSLVEVEEKDDDKYFRLKQDAYIPMLNFEEIGVQPIVGYSYSVDKTYKVINGKRIFADPLKTMYMFKGTSLNFDTIMVDSEGDCVFLDRGV